MQTEKMDQIRTIEIIPRITGIREPTEAIAISLLAVLETKTSIVKIKFCPQFQNHR